MAASEHAGTGFSRRTMLEGSALFAAGTTFIDGLPAQAANVSDPMVPVLPVTRIVIVQLHVANPRRWWMMWRTSAVWKRGWTAKELSTYATRNET